MSRSLWLALVGVLLAGLLFRTIELGRASYMIDEINVVRDAVQQPSVARIYQTELDRFTTYHRLPLLMIILHAACKGLGFSGSGFPPEWMARLPFALWGTVSIGLIFFLVRRIRGPTAALWASALMAFNVFHLFYSREAYDYSLVVGASAGVLWTGIGLARVWLQEPRFSWRYAGGAVAFSWLLLNAHLSGLLFLASWHAVVGVALLMDSNSRRRLFRGAAIVNWLATALLPYLLFAPFLFRLGGFQVTEAPDAARFEWGAIPEVLGRMGWGEAWWALLPFLLSLAASALAARSHSESRREIGLLFAVGLLYVAVQSYALRVSRFEVRYYSALFPILVALSAVGLAHAAARLGKWVRRPALAHACLAVPLAAWLLPNAWTTVQLECRGFNYKGLAQWIHQRVPNKGIYIYWNIYEARGVPAVYDTPGRSMAYPVPWSSADDYIRYQVPERLEDFFLRFPQCYYVEITPTDLIAPDKLTYKPARRDGFFAQREWLVATNFTRLARWKTLPLGDLQWSASVMDRILINYNRPEDLPELARARGQWHYHAFGPEWQYVKDRQMNDWLAIQSSGSIFLGNNSDTLRTATVKLGVVAPPDGARLNMYTPGGGKVLEYYELPGSYTELNLPNIPLRPGRTEFALEVLPKPGSLSAQLYLHHVRVEPSS